MALIRKCSVLTEIIVFQSNVVNTTGQIIVKYACLSLNELRKKVEQSSRTGLLVHPRGATWPLTLWNVATV